MSDTIDPFVRKCLTAAQAVATAKLLTEDEGTKNILSTCNTLITLALRLHEESNKSRANGE